MAEIAEPIPVLNDTRYRLAADAQLGILHLLGSAFMENPQWAK